jgi:tetratricopeptide (TPR) repeat protein
MTHSDEESHATPARNRPRTVLLVCIIVAGLSAAAALSRWIDDHRPLLNARNAEERLYLSGPAVRRLSLGFNGLVADWYWMRTLQYVGNKILNYQGRLQLDNLGPLNLRLLGPLLDATTTLDPQFLAAYEYGAMVLPAVNIDEAKELLKKGVAANPSSWRLYQNLGYIYWQRHEYQTASAAYAAGARLPGAPDWMKALSAYMESEGGSPAAAREMYTRLYEQTDDQQMKQLSLRRLMQLDSNDEREMIRHVLTDYAARTGHCPASWRELTALLAPLHLRLDNGSGAPLDPSNARYRLADNGCDVELDPSSSILRQ